MERSEFENRVITAHSLVSRIIVPKVADGFKFTPESFAELLELDDEIFEPYEVLDAADSASLGATVLALATPAIELLEDRLGYAFTQDDTNSLNLQIALIRIMANKYY